MADESGAPAIEGLLETSLYARDLRAPRRSIAICSA